MESVRTRALFKISRCNAWENNKINQINARKIVSYKLFVGLAGAVVYSLLIFLSLLFRKGEVEDMDPLGLLYMCRPNRKVDCVFMYSFVFKTQYILRLKAKIICFFLNLVSAGFCTTPSNHLTFLIVEEIRKSLALKQKILLIISSIHRLDYQYFSTCHRIDGCLVYN